MFSTKSAPGRRVRTVGFPAVRDIILTLAFFLLVAGQVFAAGDASNVPGAARDFPPPLQGYHDETILRLGAKLAHRVVSEPFNGVATLIFFAAIVHTFLAGKFLRVARRYHDELHALGSLAEDDPRQAGIGRRRDHLQFRAQMFHFLGEVEAVFGIWVLPLAAAITVFKGWGTMVHYVADTSYAEPVFVVVIMAIASSRPVLCFAESCLGKAAALAGGGPAAWWLAILTLGPLLGSFITEPAAMTICALLLSRRFFDLSPSLRLRYATLALLFANISVGGTLTHFAAPPVVMVAHHWGWDLGFMLANFGWKAVTAIVVVNAAYYFHFRRELAQLSSVKGTGSDAEDSNIPWKLTAVHLGFIAWTVVMSHYPPLVVIGFLLFLAFIEGTERHQHPIALRGPLLVGFFLAALILHGGCQAWWISPLLAGLSRWPLMLGSTLLTAVNDNAAIAYLATLAPNLSDSMKYAVLAGAVTGGGLTVIANAPNPAGQSLLQRYFGEEGISPLRLFLAALIPTIVMGVAFMLLP